MPEEIVKVFGLDSYTTVAYFKSEHNTLVPVLYQLRVH
jgi:hypothetical protein